MVIQLVTGLENQVLMGLENQVGRFVGKSDDSDVGKSVGKSVDSRVVINQLVTGLENQLEDRLVPGLEKCIKAQMFLAFLDILAILELEYR